MYLSHFFNQETPGYGGKKSFFLEEDRCMSKGDACNQLKLSLSNHVGTHIDLPYHFSASGKKMQDYAPGDWFFRNPWLVDVSATRNSLILPKHLPELPADIDFLLLRTGFEKLRSSQEYWAENPGLTPELGDYLKQKYRHLKAVGMDFISATAQQHKAQGRLAHQSFLGDANGPAILLLEDMKLGDLKPGEKISLLHVAPLLIESADGAPVTVSALI